ncbi:MAG: amidohydrolase [Planctomycetota bacterium]
MTRFFTLTAILITAATTLAQPDLVLLDANIHTVDPDRPRAQAMAIEDGAITAVGSNDDILQLVGKGTRVDRLNGATVLPGLIDAHGHLGGLGSLSTGVVDLAGTTSYDEVIQRVVDRAAETPEGEWILGRGWDHESWSSRELPTHDRLSEAVPNHPVWLSRVDGHAALGNAEAMRRAGVDASAESPAGGEVIRTANNKPTGVFVDNAETLVARAIPNDIFADSVKVTLAAQERCLSAGLTGVHDMGVSPQLADLYKKMADSGELKLRVYAVLSAAYAVRYFDQNEPYAGERVQVRACKLYMDGAMGSRGAWLLEPYDDRKTDDAGEPYTGLAVSEVGLIESVAAHGLQRGYQVCTHAIGDRANREVLDAYARAAESTGLDLADARFRVEHAQMLHPDDIPRFAQLGVLPSMQPKHATSDMRWVADRIGDERALGTYAWAALLQTGIPIPAGSDFPVEPHEPLRGFCAAVTRQDETGYPEGGWLAHERMTREEALRSMTLDAAKAAFMEDLVGSLTPGKRADFVVLTHDIMTVEPAEILKTRVVRTYIDGEMVYADGFWPE